MILAACTRVDTALALALPPALDDSQAWMRSRRFVLAAVAVLASVLDLVLTQTILSVVAGRTGAQPAEANPFMAPIVMTWWAWPFRVGIPCLAIVRDLRAGNYALITTAAGLYGLVVVWNTNILLTIHGAFA